MSCKDITYRSILISTLFAMSGVVTAASFTFNSPLTSDLITEGGVFNGSVNYTPGLWAPGEVISATLSIKISDDPSSNFDPSIDAPREWAQITSINDGVVFVGGGGLPQPEEVDPHLFTNPPEPQNLVDVSSNAGIENPDILPSSSDYFNVDVASILNSSNSGLLEFSIIALALYPDITATSNPEAYALILADSGIPPALFPDTIFVIEDFNFEQARLTVDIASEVPLPPAIWLFTTGLVSLLLRNKRVA